MPNHSDHLEQSRDQATLRAPFLRELAMYDLASLHRRERYIYLFIYLFIFYIHMRPDLSYDGWPRTIPKEASVGPMFILAT